ncbi:invasion associated locus B family protein [Georhizobium sp. MAB10]|jgi:invasion protein IalB|uniref:invasion associated locus B family protein n=1 Tax=Georhizobium sp. MAB10 TaxID=3028319 RepID=UPI003855FB9F
MLPSPLSVFIRSATAGAAFLALAALPLSAQAQDAEAPAEAPAAETPAEGEPAPEAQTLPETQPSPSQSGAVRSTHGAWSIVCDEQAGAPDEQCALMQNVIAEDRPEVGLSVVVLKTADDQARILRVLAPLGVLLPNGLGLNVDGEDIGRAYFVRCFTDGCYAEVILEDELLETLGDGTTATFIVFQTPEEGIGIPVDLDGFEAGFAALP